MSENIKITTDEINTQTELSQDIELLHIKNEANKKLTDFLQVCINNINAGSISNNICTELMELYIKHTVCCDNSVEPDLLESRDFSHSDSDDIMKYIFLGFYIYKHILKK